MGTEDVVREVLRRQVDGRDPRPSPVAEVRGRARRIRRRRLAVGGAAVALAVVPLGALLVPGVDERPPQPADPPVAVKVTDGSLDLAALPFSGDPQVPYLHDRRLVDPDGTVAEVATPYDDVVRTADGWVGIEHRADQAVLVRLGRSGRVTDAPQPGARTIAVNSDRTLFSTYTAGGLELEAAAGGVVSTWSFDPSRKVEPVGVLGADQVVFNTVFDGDRLAMVARPGGPTSSDKTGPMHGMLAANGVSSTGLVSGLVSFDDSGSCSVVQDGESSARLFRTCDYVLASFSPDGRYVHGRPAYLDGHGDGRITILTSTGEVVWSLSTSLDQPFSVTDAVWEDDTHLLAVVYQDDHWRIVRFGVDGSVSAASELVAASDLDNPFRLGAG